MNFEGTGKRLVYADYEAAAERLGVPVATILGVVEIEASGRGFDARNRPTVLFEPHIFWKYLGAGAERDRAASLGLAYANWGARPYPTGSADQRSQANYDRIAAACSINEEVALKSASWGLPQIMGFNHVAAGYDSAVNMVKGFLLGEAEQLNAFVSLILAWGIADKLRKRDAAGFARTYNGPNYAQNQYDVKLARAWAKFDKQAPPLDRPDAGVQTGLRLPSLEELFKAQLSAVQGILKEMGIATGPVDGKPGPKTVEAVTTLLKKLKEMIRA